MNTRDYLLLIAGMAAATYLPRMLPLVALSRRQLPLWFTEWLELVPAAILAAVLAPTLFAGADPRAVLVGKTELLAAVPTFIWALRTRSLAGTVLFGMICYWGIQQIR